MGCEERYHLRGGGISIGYPSDTVDYKQATLNFWSKQFGKLAYLSYANINQPELSGHPQLIFYTNRSLLPAHLLQVFSLLPLQLFGTTNVG